MKIDTPIENIAKLCSVVFHVIFMQFRLKVLQNEIF